MQRISQLVVWMTLFVLCRLSSSAEASNFTDCGGKEKASTLLDIANDFVKKAKNLYPDCGPDPGCPKHVHKPIDCWEVLLESGEEESGVHLIWPRTRAMFNTSISVYCDMDTDEGGWTIIQRRGNFSTPKDYFYKDWKSYKHGFGNLEEEFWIGNDNIHAITNQANYTIRFDLEDAEGNKGYAEYNTFWIENEDASYALHIEGYSGNVGDAMSNNNQMKFSTKDRKNDLRKDGSCAKMRRGAWWYNGCTIANLNGLYQPGIDSDEGITWQEWTKEWVSLAGVEMKLRPQLA